MTESEIIESGALQFSVDSRVLRELGERLVRRPETALVELIKNSYDADATVCRVYFSETTNLIIEDDGQGMTLEQFVDGWMRIGTAAKASRARTTGFGRQVTGEKGIGRFSVRFLGEKLSLTTVSYDTKRRLRTRLAATFDWPKFDTSEDIGLVAVPYELTEAATEAEAGTRLEILDLRGATATLDLKQVRTASIGLVSPLQSLMSRPRSSSVEVDPGFMLTLGESDEASSDIATRVLEAFELRATLAVRDHRLLLRIFARDDATPYFEVVDSLPGQCGDINADIRFFPRRAGAFRDLGIDGRRAYTWIRENSGIAVFDRDFRVSPYGEPGDDWLRLTEDAASNQRHPRSGLAMKHFPMTDAEQTSTSENWMLRLPESAQLVGMVQVVGAREDDLRSARRAGEGLIAAADREGFIANDAYAELFDVIRGSVEAMAMSDRRRQKEREEAERQARLEQVQQQAAEAARQIQENRNIPASDKARLISAVTQLAEHAEEHERATRERIRQLEVMSLLGVVAGFMTHEFGVALDELDQAYHVLVEAVPNLPALEESAERLATARSRLADFMDYSSAYIAGARSIPNKPYPALPRLRHVRGAFERYADERGVSIETNIARDVQAPHVPTSLYDGVLLNLLTNALKATTSIMDNDGKRVIAFRAWNEKDWHHLEVSDTGVGIPTLLRERIFDPLFTTTESNNDPLGSGMGLGLALVKASVEAFGGSVRVIDPPSGFSTCIQVRLPLKLEE